MNNGSAPQYAIAYQVVPLDAGEHQRDVQRGRAVHHCNRTRAAAEGRGLAFEAVDVRADARHEGGVDGVEHELAFAPAEHGGMQGNEFLRAVLFADEIDQAFKHP
jgi:hypothetical protein